MREKLATEFYTAKIDKAALQVRTVRHREAAVATLYYAAAGGRRFFGITSASSTGRT